MLIEDPNRLLKDNYQGIDQPLSLIFLHDLEKCSCLYILLFNNYPFAMRFFLPC